MNWPVSLTITVTLSYLLGSVPFALLLGKVKGIDIRQAGSRNIGATNLTRLAGRTWGVAAFLLDFLKGLLPVLVTRWLWPWADDDRKSRPGGQRGSTGVKPGRAPDGHSWREKEPRRVSLRQSSRPELHCRSQNSTDKLSHQVVPRNARRASVTPSTRPRRSAPRSTNPDTPRCLTRVLVPEIPRRNFALRTTRSPVAIPTTAVSANITQPESATPRWGQYPRCRPQQRRSNNRRPAPVGTPWW